MASIRNINRSRKDGGASTASRSRIFGTSKSRVVDQSAIGVNSGSGHGAHQVIVNGFDLTPQSLLSRKVRVPKKKKPTTKQKTGGKGNSTTKVLQNTGSRANFSSASISKLSDTTQVEEDPAPQEEESSESDTEKVSALEMRKKALQRMKELEDVGVVSTEKISTNDEPQLDSITIQLQETDTVMLFELQSVCIALDSKQHSLISEKNEKYHEMCKQKQGSDLYLKQHSQTLNFSQKNKEVMAAPPATRDAECDATVWDIHDCQELDDDIGNDNEDATQLDASKTSGKKNGKHATILSRQVNEVVEANLSSPGCLLDVDEDIITALKYGLTAESINIAAAKKDLKKNRSKASGTFSGGSRQNIGSNSNISVASKSRIITNESTASLEGSTQGSFDSTENENSPMKAVHVDVNEIIAQHQSDYILKHGTLPTNLSILERAVQQNNFHSRHLEYRNFPSASDDSTLDEKASIVKLWSFHFNLTERRTVSCMAWNPVNQDLLAVSYGEFEFTNQIGGLVLFWSLKNPEYPEREYHLEYGVTSIDFSTAHPNLLAVGLYNGVVAIYDTRREEDAPILESGQSSGTHMDAVWQVKWVDKGSERGENLVSISSDGRVTEWSMKKGLSYTDLMLFKRIASQSIQTDGVISRTGSGHCIDFAKSDSSVYFAGTEDGVIHKCSCSYNEQYLQSYFGHAGPVYRVRISPFASHLILSCSADWTVKLWDQNQQSQVLTFHSADLAHAVHDVAWSPTHSNVFGSCTEDGRIEIWDLSHSTLDPIVTHYPKSSEKKAAQTTSILFAPTAPVIAVGDSNGQVAIYRLPVLATDVPSDPAQQLEQLNRAISSEGIIDDEKNI